MNYEKRLKRIRKQISMRMKRAKKDIRYSAEKTIDGKLLQVASNRLYFMGIEMIFTSEKHDSPILNIRVFNTQINIDNEPREYIPSNEFIRQYLYRNWIREWFDEIEAFLRAWDLENIRK